MLEAVNLFNAATTGAANVVVILVGFAWWRDRARARASHRAQLAAMERAGQAVAQAPRWSDGSGRMYADKFDGPDK